MKMKIFSAILVILALVAIVGGFLRTRHVVPATPMPTPPKSQPLRIGLNPWIGNGLYYVAKEKGFFAAEHLDVELVNFDDGATGKQLFTTNKIHMLPYSPETAVILADKGVAIKIVGMSDSSQGADGIVATSNIQSLKDLKGKKVAFEVGSPSHLFISYILDNEGLSTNDLTVVDSAAPDAGASFVAGKVDAAVTWEPWLSKAKERAGGHLLVSSKVLPIFPDMYIFRADVVQKRPQDVKAMERALFAARAWILSRPDESIPIIAKAFQISNQEVTDQLSTFKWLSYEENLASFASGEPTKLVQKAADLWLKLGLIQTKINASELIDDSILKNLYQ